MVDHEQPHSGSIQQWVNAVDSKHKEFSKKMDTYKRQLEQTLGIQNRRNSAGDMSSSSHKEKLQHRELNEEKRKSARKRE